MDNGVSCYPEEVLPKYKISTTLSSRVARLNPNWNDHALVPVSPIPRSALSVDM